VQLYFENKICKLFKIIIYTYSKMGNHCCNYFCNNANNNNKETEYKNFFALKVPNGTSYFYYSNKDKKLIKDNDINFWIKNLYKKSSWSNWLVYNDQTEHIGHNNNKKAHAKGIITWNNNKISWLCHSVPNFPEYFSNDNISDIRESELIYGQSFQYIEFEYNDKKIYDIMHQLYIMNVHIYIEKYDVESVHYDDIIYMKLIDINKIQITDTIVHIAKSPNYEIDIYSDYIGVNYDYKWKIESWIRGHNVINNITNIEDIKNIKIEEIEYTETQDHSKWGYCDDFYWIGDLNRMTSQYKRGGGGFICQNIDLIKCLKNITN
jgi:hypothetical protein